MEKTNLFSRIISIPFFYDLSQTITGGYRFKRKFVNNITPDIDGKRVLDIGCGTGFLASIIPDCEYTGIDIDEKSIDRARERALDHCQFICADASQILDEFGPATFDSILATGIFHHLSPAQCDTILEHATQLLVPGGNLFGFEPAYIDNQSRMARFIVSQDRGSNVQHVDDWLKMLRKHFKDVVFDVRHDAFLQPYTLLTFQVSNQCQ